MRKVSNNDNKGSFSYEENSTEKSPVLLNGAFGCRTRIRTQTNRVRVCRATFTQFGNAYCSNIYYNASSKNVNTFIKK